MSETTWELLSEIVDETTYRPEWELRTELRSDGVMMLQIISQGYDTHHVERGQNYCVLHEFIVPPATYNRQSWTRWILDCLIKVETHEACEFFKVGGRLPFAPNHGPGWEQYGVRELNTAEYAETNFRGVRQEGTHS